MNLQDLLDCTIHVVLAWRLGVKDLHRECTTGDGKAGSVAVELGELDKWALSGRFCAMGERFLTFSAFIVAEVTISFKSLRRDRTAKRVSKVQNELAKYKTERAFIVRTLAKQTHEHICTKRTLVRLIQNNDAVTIQVALVQRLTQ